MKRLLDISVALCLLTVFAPCMLVVFLVVKWKMGSPVLFIQERPGQYGEIFRLYKFKTMTDEKDVHGNVLPDEQRLTACGKVIRKYSLDELPQLFNVLKGDMSLVGPRPLLKEYLPLYSEEQFRRHHVKPGLTGWAQINGRNELTWEEKFQLDLWYVDHQNVWLDIKILLKTIRKVVKKDGIHQPGSVSMTKFKGSKEVV